MATEFCTSEDLVYEVNACTGGAVTIEVYPVAEDETTLNIEYYDEGGNKRHLQLKAGKRPPAE